MLGGLGQGNEPLEMELQRFITLRITSDRIDYRFSSSQR